MEPRGCNRSNQWQSALPPERRKQAKSVADGCHRLPETFHGKQGVCRGCHPLREVPSLRRRGSTAIRSGSYFLLLQSGHGHWSQPQPVHASRIMRTVYRHRVNVRSPALSVAGLVAVC